MRMVLKLIRHGVNIILKVFGRYLSDKHYCWLQYFVILGQFPDLDNPKLYTEKLQWLKIYDHNPYYTKIVDKYEVKDIVSKKIGEKYVIPTLAVWDAPEDVVFESLPNKFVLKTTFGGGGDGVVICRDKSNLNKTEVIKKLRKSFKTNPYARAREWPYKDVPHRIIAEQYMEDEYGELRDYKFYCFDGVPKVMLVASNRYTNHNFNYFDMNFNVLPITSIMGTRSDITIERPVNFEEMKEVASKLSTGFTHVRVDLYNSGGKVLFGELTLYDSSGYDNLNSEEWNRLFGDWINMPMISQTSK